MSPRMIIIAGPNGAGKSTFAATFLSATAPSPRFVDADAIAAALPQLPHQVAAIRAGRAMLRELDSLAAARRSFAFETTLAGRTLVHRLRAWRSSGYHTCLLFLSLPAPELAIARVRQRIRQGGHGVEETVIRQRFSAGARNFQRLYRHEVDAWIRFDSSGSVPILTDWSSR